MKKGIILSVLLMTIVLSGCKALKTYPIIEIGNIEYSVDSIVFEIDIIDPDSVGEVTAIELFLGDELEESFSDLTKREFLDLTSNLEYDIKVTYTFDLKDGLGEQNLVASYTFVIVDATFETIFENLELYFPKVITSNLTLPDFSTVDTSLSYDIDCADIVRNRIVYTYPSDTTTCNIVIEATYKDEMRTKNIEVVMSSIDDLPRIPEIHINTINNTVVDSKEYYVDATLNLIPNEGSEFEGLNNVSLRIKLRGNSTLYMPKKSYKIKFDDKQLLLSTYQEKTWVLLANFSDQTLIRNHIAYSMSENLGMEFAPGQTLVDVYLNGEYLGNYLLSDQIEVSSNRVNVEEEVPDLDTGYLVELDLGLYREGLENTEENYFLINGIPFVVKSPKYDKDYYREGHLTYIQNYFEDVYYTLQNNENYSDLIDIDSFIDWFIVNEVFKNVDSGYSSVYFFKDKGGKLKMGPVWDFDLSTGNPGHLGDDLRGPEGWYTSRSDKNVFFYYLMQYPEFEEQLKERWNEVYESVILRTLDDVLLVSDSIVYSSYMNFLKWDIIGINYDWYTAPEIYDLKTYDEQVWFLHDYLEARIEWLNEEINK